MKPGRCARLLFWATPLLLGFATGCGDFWQAPGGGSAGFALTNSGNITVAPGSSNSATITVTPSNSFTGTVTLTCAVTTSPSGATSPTTCSLSPTSVTISGTSTQTATLTASTTTSTTTGAYTVTVTGVSGSLTETTSVCVEVTSTSGSCGSSATNSGNFYILDAGSSPGIVGASIVSGSLTTISGSPWLVSGVPYSMAIAPNGSFLVVSTITGVYSFPITSGVLGTGVLVSQVEAYGVQVDTTSSWILESIPGTGGFALDAVPVNSTTGASPGAAQTQSYGVTNAALQPNQMVISGDDANIFVALGSGGTAVVSFNHSAASGTNPLASSGAVIGVENAGQALSVAVDPGASPRLLYIGETLADPTSGTSGGLRVFNYSSLAGGSPTQATGSPIASGGLAPNFILPLSTGTYAGDYVYVANGAGQSAAGNVTGFNITAGSGAAYTIATDTSTAAGAQPLGLAEDSTGSYVFAVGSLGSPYFDAYSFDPATPGKLDSQVTTTTAANSIAIVAAP